ncbi:MAG: MBL fold metallo-hydrolase [Thermodesulfobacteriota bacterium]|nr:MBL fold metallo-hydrolase [Thermodesulfobacteriota bacterium]
MKITILYDNSIFKEGLLPDWGFAAFIEFQNKKILFDTGGNGRILLSNMKKMNISPREVDEIFLSHHHFDHIGGLSAFLNKNNNVTVYAPSSLRGIKNAAKLKYIDTSTELHENIYSTGELAGIEQSLLLKTDKGIVIIAGCSHPGLESIIKTATAYGRPYAVIGGFHGFDNYPVLQDLKLVCPTHCTMHIKEIKEMYRDKYVKGGAGRIIKI